MIVCVSASTKFKKEIARVSQILHKLNIPHFLPVILPEQLDNPNIIQKLVFEHFNKISKSNLLLVVNPGGYIGNSVMVEIGYAKGIGKTIIFLENTNKIELDCLADNIIHINELHLLKSKIVNTYK